MDDSTHIQNMLEIACYGSFDDVKTLLRDKLDSNLRMNIMSIVRGRFLTEKNNDKRAEWVSLLEELALSDKQASVRVAATSMLHEPEPLSKILENSTDSEVRKAAAKECLPANNTNSL